MAITFQVWLEMQPALNSASRATKRFDKASREANEALSSEPRFCIFRTFLDCYLKLSGFLWLGAAAEPLANAKDEPRRAEPAAQGLTYWMLPYLGSYPSFDRSFVLGWFDKRQKCLYW